MPITFAALASEGPANEFVRNVFWIRRWSTEIDADAQLDRKKLALLALVHCRLFIVAMGDDPSAEFGRAVKAAFERHYGISWASLADMRADLVALKVAAEDLLSHVRANFAGVPHAEISITSSGKAVETPIVGAKPAGVTSRVASLRAVFG